MLKRYLIIYILGFISCYLFNYFTNKSVKVSNVQSSITAEAGNIVITNTSYKVSKEKIYITNYLVSDAHQSVIINNDLSFNRKDLQYSHKLSLESILLSDISVLVGLQYQYKQFGITGYGGYNIKHKETLYGIGFSYQFYCK